MGQNYATGTPTIAAYLVNGVVSHNVFAGGAAAAYPSTNFFPTVAAWQGGFVNWAAGDYRLSSSSPYRNAASDGKAVGADLSAVQGHTDIAVSGNNAATSPSPTAPGGFRIVS
jgi:hypothetical protein